jgi:hypothetical protein
MLWFFTVGFGESGIATEPPRAVSSALAPPSAVVAKFRLAGNEASRPEHLRDSS